MNPQMHWISVPLVKFKFSRICIISNNVSMFVLLTHFAPTVHFFPLAGDSISHGKELFVWLVEQRRWQYCQQNTIFWVRISEYRGLLSGIISMEWENCPSFCRIKIDGIFVSVIRLTSFFFFDEEWPKCFI